MCSSTLHRPSNGSGRAKEWASRKSGEAPLVDQCLSSIQILVQTRAYLDIPLWALGPEVVPHVCTRNRSILEVDELKS